MARNWTAAQRAAIDERERTLLVSAAAGSGKTAVLTERIIQSLTDTEHPADISRILVVTFTRAAAGELRTRISKALTDALALNPTSRHLANQLMLLGGASISTIDSFYLELVRAHFEATDLPASFRMADDSELLPLRRACMNDTVEQMYAQSPDFHRLADIFGTLRSEEPFIEALLELYRKLETYTESIEVLARSAKEIRAGAHNPLDTKLGAIFLRELRLLVQEGHTLFANTAEALAVEDEKAKRKYGAVVAECNGYFEELTKALESDCFADIHALLLRPLTQKVGGGKKPADSHRFNTLWELADAYRKGWSTNAAKFAAFSPEEVAQSAEETAALLTLLHTALTRFHADYRAEKKRREIAEFSDVSRAAYNLLLSPNGSPTALARELAASFDAIYIDEYQDVNTMQDTTFRAISTERNRFMVGDIKQSIYSFRGAQPAIFADYRRRFPPLADAVQKDAPCASVQMANCFRCDAPVIDFSNTVSGFLFDRCRDSIGYTKEDDLVFSKPAPETPSPACRVVLIDREKKDADEQPQSPPLGKEANSELCWIAQEIERLLCEERKADGSRITPDDIAVLTRGAAYAEPLARLLRARGIKVNNTSHKSLFENPEVLCMYSLLATIDNPTRDIHLAAALRSPFFGFTLSDLVRLRNGSDRALSLYEALCEAVETGRVSDQALLARCADFLARLRLYREKAEHLPVDRLLRYLYRETAVLGLCAQGTGGVQRENLNQLYEYARRFEGGGYKGLYAFIRYVDDVLKNNTAMPTVSDERDAVSLITIHHSKGLEFPVCFIAGAASAFNTEDAEVPILLDEAIGCATMLPNAGPFSRAHTFWRSALAMELMRRNLEQEMRVLYVAMTRARERLYITARPQWGVQTPLEQAELRAFADSLFPARTLFPKGRSFLDWILTALATKPSHEECTVEILQESEISTLPDAPAPTANANNFTSENVKENVADVLRQRFAFVYPYQHLTRLPAKLSVSRLSPVVLDVFDTDAASSPANWQTPDAKALLESFDRLPFSVESKQTAADRGTATHEFLQFCDFERAARKGVAWELERLIEEGFLPPEIKDAVRMDELEHFFESDLYHSLAKASDVHRETRFHIFLPAEYFTKDAEFAQKLGGERLPVQGVIDLFFTDADGKLILCDYKTDRLTRDELANPALAAATLGARHGEQLSYYALALQELCGRAPDRVLIYSLPLGRALDVTLPPICASS